MLLFFFFFFFPQQQFSLNRNYIFCIFYLVYKFIPQFSRSWAPKTAPRYKSFSWPCCLFFCFASFALQPFILLLVYIIYSTKMRMKISNPVTKSTANTLFLSSKEGFLKRVFGYRGLLKNCFVCLFLQVTQIQLLKLSELTSSLKIKHRLVYSSCYQNSV